jgi:hypothetical protein
VGATLWAPINFDLNTVRSESFDIDNGAGTTVDRLLIRHPRPIQIVACRIVYDDATTGTVAAGTAKVGTTVGGAEIVAATALRERQGGRHDHGHGDRGRQGRGGDAGPGAAHGRRGDRSGSCGGRVRLRGQVVRFPGGWRS